MQTKAYHTVDKSDWEQGPWTDEPDKMQWPDEETGLPCLIVRGPSGALCGYVGVAEGHPAFKRDYDEVYSLADIEVHGGLTYADMCQPSDDESRGICHLPDPGERDHVWWLGFDCAHAGDVCPKYDSKFDGDVYRSISYVKGHCGHLAHQLKAMEGST